MGFGAPLLRRRLGLDQTEWVVAAFPLGGYVKMLDEREGEVAPQEVNRAFNRQSVYRRFAIVAGRARRQLPAGDCRVLGRVPARRAGRKPLLGAALPSTPAAQAGMTSGETIVRIGDQPVTTWEDVRWVLLEQVVDKGSVTLEVQNEKGEIAFRRLDLSTLGAADLDSDFLNKIGLSRFSPAVIGEVQAGKAGERAGLRSGDVVIAVDAKPITSWEELVAAVQPSAGKRLVLTIRRGNETLEIPVVPDGVEEGGRTLGRIGLARDVSLLEKQLVQVRYGPLAAFGQAVVKTWEISALSLQHARQDDHRRRIAQEPERTDHYRRLRRTVGADGMALLPVSFIALISISLGVLNLLPVPVLDGGHLMYYIVEIIKGRPVSERALEIGQRIGMVVLFSLMAFALYNDIHRLVGG